MQDAQQQLLAVQSQAAQVAKAKARMEVETLRISQRIEILNNISTQATLLAGSSITFLGGEALETVDDFEYPCHRQRKRRPDRHGKLEALQPYRRGRPIGRRDRT